MKKLTFILFCIALFACNKTNTPDICEYAGDGYWYSLINDFGYEAHTDLVPAVKCAMNTRINPFYFSSPYHTLSLHEAHIGKH